MRRILLVLRRTLALVFGEVSWRPPAWLKAIGRFLSRIFARPLAILKTYRKTSLGVALLLAAALAVYYYWPEPEVAVEPDKIVLTVRVKRPDIKGLKDKENPPLRLLFDNSAAKIEQVDKEIKPDGIEMDPEMEGTWRWRGDRELVFTPKAAWPIKQTFTISIDPDFFPEHTVFEQQELEFTTHEFIAKITNTTFVSDPVDPDRKFVVASFQFSHPVDRKRFEEQLELRYGDPKSKKEVERYQFEVTYDAENTIAHVHSHNIPIPLKPTPMVVWADKDIKAQQGGPGSEKPLSKTVTVPGMYSYFKIDSASLAFARDKNNDPEQIIALQSKLEVHEDEIKKRFKAWVLPKDKPATEDEEAKKNYHWSPADVDAKVLRKSEPVALEHVPGERAFAAMHTMKFKAQVGRQIYMRLEKHTKAWGGYVLAEPYDAIDTVPPFPKELAIMHDGAILSTAGARTLSVMSRGLPGVEIQLARVMKSEMNHLLSQSSGRFQSPSFNYGFGPENIAEIMKEKRVLDNSDPAKSQYTAIDFSAFVLKHGGYRDKGLFLLKVSAWSPSGYAGGRTDQRLVLITDLGIIAKQDANRNHQIFVQTLSSGLPKAGAQVAVLGKNGLPVLTARTDAAGHAAFPPLDDFIREKRPVGFVVTAGDDYAYLPIDRSDRFINYARFDVGGVTTDGTSDTLQAYLFSERGIYRPGDPFHIGLIVKAVDWTKPLQGFPLELVVTDPRGQEVLVEKRTLNDAGFIELVHTTEESAPTGNYNVSAYLLRKNKDGETVRRDVLGSTSVRVEEFLPDAMTIRTEFTAPATDGWIAPDQLAAKVSLRNLYGTPATDRRVTAQVSLATKHLSFKGYRDYRFHDPMAAKKGYVHQLDEGVTDENGEALFDIDLSEFDRATYALTFTAEGFEAEGGRSVTSESTVTVSPLKHVVGYKPDGGLRYISRDGVRMLRFVAINSRLKQKALSGVNAVLYENRYVSTLVKQYNGVFKYQSVPRKVQLDKARITINKEGLDYPLKTDRPGEFILELKSGKTVLAAISYSVAGSANVTSNLERNAELEVKLDKSDYVPGETISIHIKAPYTGAGLITIERDKVFAHKWFKSNETSFVETIAVPRGLDVNAYVNVAMVRALDSPEIFMAPLTTAVVPFSLSREDRAHIIDLTVPDLVKPGETLTIEYATPSPAKIAVFAVDEGILQVANYQTPDPLAHFLSKRALEVTTSQILDMLLPEYDVFKNKAGFGGGDEEDETLGRNLNPFKRKREKPVVYWSGIVDAGPEKQALKYTVPDYFNGTIRTMAVAVSRDRLGATEKKSVVRGPFVIHASPPLFAAPGDTFDLGATVANNVEGSGKNARVTLRLEVTENLEVVGDAKQTLAIPEGREKSARFKVKAKARLGNATLTFTAKHKDASIKARATMSVRPKNPHVTSVKAGYVKDGKVTVPIARRLYQEYRDLKVSVSPLPLALADGLKAYLTGFPHGCTEQIVSQTVPALLLRDHDAFGYDVEKATRAVTRTIRILQSRQNSEGGFGYWAANSHVSDQQTVYAMEFLTEAKQRGYAVPDTVISRGLSYLRLLAKTDLESRKSARLRAYAIYMLALNGILSAAPLAELRTYLAEDKENKWHRDVLLGYLAATYMIMQDRREAMQLIDKVDFKKQTEVDYEDFYDDQVYRGTLLHLIATHFPSKIDAVGGAVLAKIAKAISEGSYNTLSSARIIYGLEAYGRKVQASLDRAEKPPITVTEVRAKDKKQPLQLQGKIIARSAFSEKARALEISTGSEAPLFYQVSIAGFDLDSAGDVPESSGVEIIREFRNLDKAPITGARIGEEIEVVLKLRSTTPEWEYHLAVVDLLPSGFEVVLGSEENRIGTQESSWSPEYADLREDRVLLYGDIGPDLERFVYRIKATSQGRFAVPPAYLKSMYNPKVRSRSGSGEIAVTDK